ncbi:hypothetical protein FD00_GL000358 [Liquorilactobacillus mali KCTC 3596 = DSM 20444]|uniref:Acylphosphatase n=2 Tax=Liquorilactobacillus mali TaxID=1618 RepID=A0A0R2EDU7_9LACO|nr:hypothetical protein FD00_GL000358 [Liquorilactobacillus mali KCTC 3596 = DSM 20444]
MVADQLNIKGIVKNQSDGSVYIEAQGDPQAVHSFAKKIIASPAPSGRVSNYNIADNKIKNYTSFNVVY